MTKLIDLPVDSMPGGLALASDGTIYVSEQYNSAILRIRDGEIKYLAGCNDVGNTDGPADRATFCNPRGISIRPSDGAVFVADAGNNCIRMIKDRVVSTFAGRKEAGFKDGPLGSSLFNEPSALLWTPEGMLLVCDRGNNRIRAIKNGMVLTLAGNGDDDDRDGPSLQAGLNLPTALCLSPTRTLFIIADGKIRVLEDGKISTFLSADSNCQLHHPLSISVGYDGVIYVADCGNGRIVALDSPKINSILGAECGKDSASLVAPNALCMDRDGGLLVLDRDTKCIVKFQVRPRRGHCINLRAYIPSQTGEGILKLPIEGEESVYLHQCLLKRRELENFPSVLATIESHPSCHSAARSFVEFIYSDELPLVSSCSEWTALAYLFQQLGFFEQFQFCMERAKVAGLTMKMPHLQALYKAWSMLKVFPAGEELCRLLLRSHLAVGLLNYQLVPPDQSSGNSTPPTLPTAPNKINLKDALARLYESQEGFDVEILIEQNVAATGHSFVLSRCPLLRESFCVKLDERKIKKVQFAAPEWLLHAIMEVCYLEQLSTDLRVSLTTDDALIIVDLIDSFFERELDSFSSICNEVQRKIDQQRRLEEDARLRSNSNSSSERRSPKRNKCIIS